MMQETPRKYTKSAYTKKNLREDLRLDADGVDNDIKMMWIVNWRQVAQGKR